MISTAVFEWVKHIAGQQRQAAFISIVDKRFAVDAVRKPAPDVDPAARLLITDPEWLHLVERSADQFLFSRVIFPENIQKLVVGTVVKVAGDQLLRDPVHGHHAHGHQIGQTLDDLFIRYDKSQAQARHEGQRKRVDVDDIALRVKGFDRRQLFALVDQLRRRIFFHDRNAPAACDLEHFFASFQGKDRSGRIVKAGIDENQTRIMCRRQSFQRFGIHAVSIDRYRHDTRAGQLHRAVGVRRNRLFHDHRIARLQKQSHNEIQRLIRLCQDLDLPGRCPHAFGAEQRDDLLPQHAVTLIRTVKILRSSLFGDQRGQHPRDIFSVVNPRAGDAAAHGDHILVTEPLEQIIKGDLHVLIFILDACFPVDFFVLALFGADFASDFVLCRLWLRGMHQIADALAGVDQFFRFQFVVCLGYGIAVYPEDLRHGALGGQTASGRAFAG